MTKKNQNPQATRKKSRWRERGPHPNAVEGLSLTSRLNLTGARRIQINKCRSPSAGPNSHRVGFDRPSFSSLPGLPPLTPDAPAYHPSHGAAGGGRKTHRFSSDRAIHNTIETGDSSTPHRCPTGSFPRPVESQRLRFPATLMPVGGDPMWTGLPRRCEVDPWIRKPGASPVPPVQMHAAR